MTDKTHPEALRLADWLQAAVQTYPQMSEDEPGGYASEVDQIMDEAAAELRRQHTRIAELEAELEAVGNYIKLLADCRDAFPVPEHGSPIENEWIAACGSHEAVPAYLQAVAKQQAAPKAAPVVGSSGFDHQTAADFLSGKTVSDESVRKFVQASRWAHDEKASLSAMLISVRGELASREAEIALLKRELMEAEAAPQQEAQEPVALLVRKNSWRAGQWEAAPPDSPSYGLAWANQRQYVYAAPQPAPAELEQLRERISKMGLDVDRAMRGQVNEQSPLGTQRLAAIAALAKPAPAPLGDDVVKDAARYRWLREGNDAKHGAAWHVAVNLYGCEWDAAIDAALAAQGGNV